MSSTEITKIALAAFDSKGQPGIANIEVEVSTDSPDFIRAREVLYAAQAKARDLGYQEPFIWFTEENADCLERAVEHLGQESDSLAVGVLESHTAHLEGSGTLISGETKETTLTLEAYSRFERTVTLDVPVEMDDGDLDALASDIHESSESTHGYKRDPDHWETGTHKVSQ